MSQLPLLVGLQIVGSLLGLAFGPRARPALCCAYGFLVGLAGIVFVVLALLVTGIPYTAATAAIGLAIPALGALMVLARRPPDRRTVVVAATWTAGFTAVCAVLCPYNYTLMTFDSHQFVMFGRIVSLDHRLAPGVLPQLSDWGVFQVISHSLVGFTNQQFLYSLQPTFGLSLVPVFALTLWHGVRALGGPPSRLQVAAIGVVTVAMFTIGMVAFHVVYIHTNLASAAYLFGFVALFWLAEVTGEPELLPIAFVCLLAYALNRIETPLFALVCLTMTLFPSRLPRRAIGLPLTAFGVSIAVWFLVLAANVPADGFLTPTRCYLIAAAVAGFVAYWWLSGITILGKLDRFLPNTMLGLVGLALAAGFAHDADHLGVSMLHWSRALRDLPQWGDAWLALIALAAVGWLLEPPPHRRIFVGLIAIHFAFTLLLVLGRKPYHQYLGDSANRMTLHVLPLIFFYLALKIVPALVTRSAPAGPARPDHTADPGRTAAPPSGSTAST